MRLSLNAGARRLLRRMPRTTVYSALEIALLSVLAIECARLVWAIATPIGPLGDWRSDGGAAVLAAPDRALFERFDPFFRLEGDAPIVVTDLDLTLFGVREDRASGRGSAIIALPDGEQYSFLVGDEIMPGVILAAVGFDFVSLQRNGVREQVFLDQSPAPGAAGGAAAASSGARPAPSAQPQRAGGAPPAITSRQLARGTQISPRREGDRLTGIIVEPTDDGSALRSAGLEPGDVIVAIGGERIETMDQAAGFASRIGAGNAMVQVERNGELVSVRTRVGE